MPTYYRLYDTQCGRYMHTGYNCKSKQEVKRELWDYFEPEREEVFLTNDINEVSLSLLLEIGEFDLEKSRSKFEDNDEE